MREKDWRCRKRETQVAGARQGDLAGVTQTRARQRQTFEPMLKLCFWKFSRISTRNTYCTVHITLRKPPLAF